MEQRCEVLDTIQREVRRVGIHVPDEERVQAADADKESLHLVRAGGDALATRRDSLTTGNEQAKAERDALADRICELETDLATLDWELNAVFPAVQSFKNRVTAGGTRANTERLARRWKRCSGIAHR